MHCIPFCTSAQAHHFPLKLAMQYVFPTTFCFLHKILVFSLSLKDILLWAHTLEACLHSLLVPHQNHPEKLCRLKYLMTLTYFLFKNQSVDSQSVSKMLCVSKQGFFSCMHTQKKAVKNEFFSLVEFNVISVERWMGLNFTITSAYSFTFCHHPRVVYCSIERINFNHSSLLYSKLSSICPVRYICTSQFHNSFSYLENRYSSTLTSSYVLDVS